jgi:hypothetical protein
MEVVQGCTQRVIDMVDDSTRLGGCITFLLASPQVPGYHSLATIPVGLIPEGRLSRYSDFSLEKALRLLNYPSHLSSRESRSEPDLRFAGAVRGKHFVISFSGFPEDFDELLALWLAVLFGQLSPEEALEIAKLSVNEPYLWFALTQPELQFYDPFSDPIETESPSDP